MDTPRLPRPGSLGDWPSADAWAADWLAGDEPAALIDRLVEFGVAPPKRVAPPRNVGGRS